MRTRELPCTHGALDIRGLDWNVNRQWRLVEGTHFLCEHHIDTLRASAYLYGEVSCRRVDTRIENRSPNRVLTIRFFGQRKLR